MKPTLGFILLLLGSAIMLYGIGAALYEISTMYAEAINDPMGNKSIGGGATAAVEPKQVSAAMLRAVGIGCVGIPLAIAGSFLMRSSVFAFIRKIITGPQPVPQAGARRDSVPPPS